MIIIPNILKVLNWNFSVRTENLIENEDCILWSGAQFEVRFNVYHMGIFFNLSSLLCCIYKNVHRNIANKTFSIQIF